MVKYMSLLFFILISTNIFCQNDSIKLINEIDIDLSIQNNLSWESYNKKINPQTLMFSGKGFFNGKYYKNGKEISFEGEINHKKDKIDIYSTNIDKNIDTLIEKLINNIFNISYFYYFKSNKKGQEPYEEYSIQKGNNIWEFRTYKETIKKSNHMEDKKVMREITLDDSGKIKKIITSLTHKNDIPLQNHFQDHHIEIDVVSYGIKQKYSQIKGEIVGVSSKNKIEFSIVFP